MFFMLSKTLTFLIMPLTIITLALVAGIIFNHKKWGKKIIITGIILLIFFSNNFLINEIMKLWEYPPVKYDQLEQHDVGVILGGVTNNEKKPTDRIHVNQAVERVLHTIQLYKKGLIKKILVSGGSGKLFPEGPKEAEQLAGILNNSGVPEEDIYLEAQSRNTRENALNTKKLIEEQFNNPQIILITSAFHMRRAKACFDKVNLKVTPFSTDLKTVERKYTPGFLLIPSPNAINKWGLLIKEWGGFVAYHLANYI